MYILFPNLNGNRFLMFVEEELFNVVLAALDYVITSLMDVML